MSNFTIEGRAKSLPDIQRDWTWELVIPNIGTVAPSFTSEDALTIRCRTATIPSRGNEPMESIFYGMKQFFAGKPTFGNTLAVQVEETEDQVVTKALYEWRQKIYDIEPNSPKAGASSFLVKRAGTRDIYLLMYRYNGDPMKNKIVFKNAWPQNVDDVTLDYSSNSSVKFGVTFQWDFWYLQKSA